MKKIRIGNDIKVDVDLSLYLDDFTTSSIKQLRCYFIRKQDEVCAKHSADCFPQFYTPDQYNLNLCGCHHYNVFPSNMFCDFVAPHWFPGYCGFGVNSKRFCAAPRHYLADFKILEEQNLIECYFPAKEQINSGLYKLVLVVTSYQTGWGRDNLKTNTIDCGEIFELVHQGYDVDTDTTIYITKQQRASVTFTLDENSFVASGDSFAEIGKPYSAKIAVTSGYHIKDIRITMGDLYYHNYDGNINIEEVTGDIDIDVISSNSEQVNVVFDVDEVVRMKDTRTKVDAFSYYSNVASVAEEFQDIRGIVSVTVEGDKSGTMFSQQYTSLPSEVQIPTLNVTNNSTITITVRTAVTYMQ